MSWKGFSRGVVRAPQSFKNKFNIGENTKDPVYQDAERRFQELEAETKKLHEESKKYFAAINGMLDHQIGFSQAIAEIYKPISGRVSDPTSFHDEGNDAGIEACQQYEAVVNELKGTLAPELEMIETRIIGPADELTEVIKLIRKTATKRQHKQLDYDRRRATLKSLKEKEKKDESAIYKAETALEIATQEFEFYNDLLKKDLPKLFALERDFIQPLFQSFYYMQLNIFYTLHEKMQALQIPYFELDADIVAAFEKKRGDVQEKAEALAIVKFKTQGAKMKLEALRKSKLDKEREAAGGVNRPTMDDENGTDNPPPSYAAATSPSALKPPPSVGFGAGYSPSTSPAIGGVSPRLGHAPSASKDWSSVAGKKKPAPPPPKPKPKNLVAAQPKTETVTALYDFEAQAEGDLAFRTGDVIEIVKRTGNVNEWWTGRIGARMGQFPGNYVKMN
ncbi:BAR-domain-containing protein [Ascodesmis nigricans]|uniref:BAR-domain-containing protein n=1 Tax=Ascodesmis nigricans TaxID=341454 RepID=A0A4S2MXZ3_9PEZI|nr:BAR-domain-containing protein [Ascodesmis nigricans]